MNAAVRAVVRMGLYVGAKVYFIHEVSPHFVMIIVKAFDTARSLFRTIEVCPT